MTDVKGAQPEQLVEDAMLYSDLVDPTSPSYDEDPDHREGVELMLSLATALSECREALKAADDYIDLALTISLEDPDPVLFFHVKDRYLRSLVERRAAQPPSERTP